MDHGSEITIDLGAIDHNVRAIRQLIGPDCDLCAVVKSNAYGLGAVRAARQLVASGVDMLAVFEPAEAVELFDAGIGRPVLVLMPVWEIARTHDLYRALVRGAVHLTVHNRRHCEQLIRIAERYAAPVSVHLELDTGMRRGGCEPDEASAVLRQIASHRLLRLAGVFTHFCRARDCVETTEAQRAIFDAFVDEHRQLIPADAVLHVANTAAALRGPAYRRSMVRLGVAWTGYGPEMITAGEVDAAADLLRPAVRWTSRIVLIKTVESGQTVGYGGTWTAKRRTRLGLIPVGYADGFPRGIGDSDEATHDARIGVQWDGGEMAYAPVIAALSMDQVTVDLTEAPEVGEGAAAVLYGDDRRAPNYLPTLAREAGVIPHVLLAALSPLIVRRYVTAQPMIETVARQAAERAGSELVGAVRRA